MHSGGGHGHHGQMADANDNSESSADLGQSANNEFPEEMNITLADKK